MPATRASRSTAIDSKTPATSQRQKQAAAESVEEAIRRRAYELYLERGALTGARWTTGSERSVEAKARLGGLVGEPRPLALG